MSNNEGLAGKGIGIQGLEVGRSFPTCRGSCCIGDSTLTVTYMGRDNCVEFITAQVTLHSDLLAELIAKAVPLLELYKREQWPYSGFRSF